jgi:hypothetical protein
LPKPDVAIGIIVSGSAKLDILLLLVAAEANLDSLIKAANDVVKVLDKV